MTKVVQKHQTQVQAPLQKAFDYVSDLTRHPEWSEGKLKIEAIAPGPVGVGKEYISRGEFAIQKDRPNSVRVSDFEPPHRFGFVARDPDAGDISHVFTFREQNNGILIERTMTLSLNPIAAFLFRFFLYPWIGGPSMDKSLALLKKKLESH